MGGSNRQGLRIGWIGVGRMGGRMAKRLIDAGRNVTIFDTSDFAARPLTDVGAIRVDSPAAVGSACEVVLASLPTPPVVEAVDEEPNVVVHGKVGVTAKLG